MERSAMSINNPKYLRNQPLPEHHLVGHKEAVVDVEAKKNVDLRFLI
jgi:hypothetical protein